MASNKAIVGLWALASVLLLVIGSGNTVQGITCIEALTELAPCTPFAGGTAPSPNPLCCSPVQNVNKEATTTEIRRQLCLCFQQAGSSAHINLQKLKQIPDLCHLQIPDPIDPTDCSK
ncbi:non-specific lipid-transfer protein 2 [Manihot esculenta]|uniref:Non-specific lipid-transfer protein n=1 Tax=Manihot esculenta TaxID=3983 RepID=A0A2C9UVS6_MANES|nr:non-specific lipid-transfer protein 2 [Manihot esculenta]OAY34866.1 hypothetical protein MANES_12G053200v8 [Manihot esculenta]